ncbi:MAG: hypothetical protein CSA76_06685 [Spirochaetales bacterium]|nr:MAG: hypothetical protein CSA76_06685 [Spirochaetales bacterium]
MDNHTQKQLDLASRSTMFIYALTSVALPVSLLDITRELNLSLTQAGALSFAGSIMQFAGLLAAIPIAGLIGKIRPLRWSLWVMAAGVAAFTRAHSFTAALAAVLVVVSGEAIIEGLITPLVEDIHPGDDGSRQALLHAFWPAGIICGTLVIGELLSRGVSWRVIFLGLAAAGASVSIIYPRRNRASLPRSRADFSHAGEIFTRPLFWLMTLGLFLAGGAEGGITYWSASYIRLEFSSQPRAGGMGTAFFAAGMAAGRILTSRLAPRTGLKPILLTGSGLGILSGLGLAAVHNLTFLYFLLFLTGFSLAPLWPTLQTHSVRRLNADPTMVMVFLSCTGVLGFSGINLIMGIIGDAAGLRASFFAAPGMLLLLLCILIVEKKL